MRAYYYDNKPGNPTLPHEGESIDSAVLTTMGVLFYHIPIDSEGKWEAHVQRIATHRDYKHSDVVETSRELLGETYEDAMEKVWREHLHEDEEIRYPLAGCGYFDVRELPTDRWIRIRADAGDLMVLPAGIYHRFALDSDEYIKTMRLFKEEPKWIAHYRSAETDQNPNRIKYLNDFNHAERVQLVAI
ncbi:Acireductone dioxygenase [Irpex rosettiformis]|uniref:Acireductone dioxygenase n=1 Tax=Irpex rosettiformis TaxID=378272 RepID=A0ACB8TSR8_9APHY|nr:Acireductone dioxygenase [Irpex rosettiformis]